MKNSKFKKIIKIILTTVFISLTITFFVIGYQVTEGVYNLVSREDTLKYYEEKYKSKYEKFSNKYRPKNLRIKS
ncbi:hypothetical protein [uncultured Peptoniphilus sp.]|uniref:hypothetical protein n=1 Tax=uncultured Peptoniphilus sp. TaxID=254354 RepID=UPI0028043B16|nr:hypothetical protein [uncultured Peptoniphilus sp.]